MESISKTTSRYLSYQQVEEGRSSDCWRYFFLLVLGWSSFTPYMFWRGYYGACIVSLIAVSAFAFIYFKYRHSDTSKTSATAKIIHSYIAVHVFGVFFQGVTHPALETTLMAIPIAMTIVCMLLGIRAAIPWMIAGVVAYVAYPMVNSERASFMPVIEIIDYTILAIGLPVFLFLCLHQFEMYFQRRAMDLVELSNELDKIANTDSLTDLPNRYHFNYELNNRVQTALDNNRSVTLMLLDMNGFKQVNDTMGHNVGDLVLQEIAERLKNSVGESAFVARLGGDEFCIIPDSSFETKETEELCNTVCDALSQKHDYQNRRFQLGVSIGIAVFPTDAKTSEDMLTYADTAMYYAKETFQPFVFYNPEQTAKAQEILSIREKLSQAVEAEAFNLVYQPQVNIKTGEIHGVEALLRWSDQGQPVPPMVFIPHLEESRQIIEVTRWIINTVCRQIEQWANIGLQLKVAVNISAIDFLNPGFIDSVRAALDTYDIQPGLLELEITESIFIEDPEAIVSTVTKLKKFGVKISIDDFGTGYSSLSYLRYIPVDKLKIDREFVKGIPEADDGTMTSSIINMGKKMGIQVLAEGIETQAQLDFFKNTDCDEFQGYLASKPISAPELEEYMANGGFRADPPLKVAV